MYHCDAVQAVGKLPLDMKTSTIDLLSLSGHKLHAPKGVGALYVRKGTKIRPLIVGGHQERGRRAGTENVAAVAGLGMACELAGGGIEHENTAGLGEFTARRATRRSSRRRTGLPVVFPTTVPSAATSRASTTSSSSSRSSRPSASRA